MPIHNHRRKSFALVLAIVVGFSSASYLWTAQSTLLVLNPSGEQQKQTKKSTSFLLSSTKVTTPLVVPSRCQKNSIRLNALTSSEKSEMDPLLSPGAVAPSCVYHPPPTTTDNKYYYDDNDTVFGSILRGELPARVLDESSQLLAFQDRSPRAPLHALIIPKAFYGSVFDLTADDLPLLLEMQEMVQSVLKAKQLQLDTTKTHDSDNVRLCFHIPPFHSVSHLHLHVLAPVSEMKCIYKNIKYNPHTRWCISLKYVMQRLKTGQKPVPYQRPPWDKPQRPIRGSEES